MSGRAGSYKRRNETREVRLRQILTAIWVYNAIGNGSTVAQVANSIGLSPKGYIKSLFGELAKQGYIYRKKGKHWNGEDKYTWFVHDKTLKKNMPHVYEKLMKMYGKQSKLSFMELDTELDLP